MDSVIIKINLQTSNLKQVNLLPHRIKKNKQLMISWTYLISLKVVQVVGQGLLLGLLEELAIRMLTLL